MWSRAWRCVRGPALAALHATPTAAADHGSDALRAGHPDPRLTAVSSLATLGFSLPLLLVVMRSTGQGSPDRNRAGPT
jgi:hypothetical protein